MYDSELFQNAKITLENCRGLRHIFSTLPAGTKFSIILDERIPCTLVYHDGTVKLDAAAVQGSDFDLILLTESIRRLSCNSPRTGRAFIKELFLLSLSRHISIRIHTDLKKLSAKGYANTLINFLKNLVGR